MNAEIQSEKTGGWGSQILIKCRPAFQDEHDFIVMVVGFDEFSDGDDDAATYLFPSNNHGAILSESPLAVFDTVDFRMVLIQMGYDVFDSRLH